MCALPVGRAAPTDGSEGFPPPPGRPVPPRPSPARWPVSQGPAAATWRAPARGSRRLAPSKLKPGAPSSRDSRARGGICQATAVTAEAAAAHQPVTQRHRARDRAHVAPRAPGPGPASPRHLGKLRLPQVSGCAQDHTATTVTARSPQEDTGRVTSRAGTSHPPGRAARGDPHKCLPQTWGNRGREAQVT